MKLEVKGLKILKTNPNFQHLNKTPDQSSRNLVYHLRKRGEGSYHELRKMKIAHGKGGTQQSLTRGGPAQRSNPFMYTLSYIPFLTEKKKYLVRVPSIDKWYLFHILILVICISFKC